MKSVTVSFRNVTATFQPIFAIDREVFLDTAARGHVESNDYLLRIAFAKLLEQSLTDLSGAVAIDGTPIRYVPNGNVADMAFILSLSRIASLDFNTALIEASVSAFSQLPPKLEVIRNETTH